VSLCKRQTATLESVVNGQLATRFPKTGHDLRFVSENNFIDLERLTKLSPFGEILPRQWMWWQRRSRL